VKIDPSGQNMPIGHTVGKDIPAWTVGSRRTQTALSNIRSVHVISVGSLGAANRSHCSFWAVVSSWARVHRRIV